MIQNELSQSQLPSSRMLNHDSRSVPSSPRAAAKASSPRSDSSHHIIRAESEPINVSYHPELYAKLHCLWQQTNDLIVSQKSSQFGDQSEDGIEADRSPTSASSIPQVMSSIVDSHVFKLLYNNQTNINHFAVTKQELPFTETIRNREYITWVAAKEPGMRIDYEGTRDNLVRLSKEETLRQNSPNVFNFFHGLIRAHDTFILRGARFLSYDLWMNMVNSYYGSQGDVGLLSRFPISEPAAFQEYIATSTKAMSRQALENRQRNWSETRQQWLESERVLLSIKSGREFHCRYNQLDKLMRIFRNRSEERIKRHRVLRTIQVNRRVERQRMMKTANIHTWRTQVVGQESLLPCHTISMSDDIQQQDIDIVTPYITEKQTPCHDHNHDQNEAGGQKGQSDKSQHLPNQMQGMTIDDCTK